MPGRQFQRSCSASPVASITARPLRSGTRPALAATPIRPCVVAAVWPAFGTRFAAGAITLLAVVMTVMTIPATAAITVPIMAMMVTIVVMAVPAIRDIVGPIRRGIAVAICRIAGTDADRV